MAGAMLSRLLLWVLRLLVWTLIVVCFFFFVPGLPPYVDFDGYRPKEPPTLKGLLGVNSALDGAERMLEGEVKSPESLAVRGKYVYTGTNQGTVLRMDPKLAEVKVVATLGPSCEDVREGPCSKPLGVRFGHKGDLLVADSNQGVFSVDVDTGVSSLLIPSSTAIGGKRPRIVDDLDEAKNGDIYWSDASTSCHLDDGLIEILATSSGRLLKFDPKTKKNQVLVDKIKFANGVQLSPDEDFVLVAETGKSRVLRHWLEGPRAGQTEVFVDSLPGYPDNIRASSLGGYYVSIVGIEDSSQINLVNKLLRTGFMHKVVVRFVALVQKTFVLLDSLFPNHLFHQIIHGCFNTATSVSLTPPRALAIHLNQHGDITHSLHGTDGSVRSVSQVTEHEGHLYLSSPYNTYLARVKVPTQHRDQA